MDTLNMIETIITAEALGIMIFALVKLWYYDVLKKKTSLARRVEIFLKYKWFKLTLFFTFIYVLALFFNKLVELNSAASDLAKGSSIVASLALLCLAFTVWKISSKTYGKTKFK
jgi:hypothetical protein